MKFGIKSITSFVGVLVLGLALVGCSTFGVSNSQWKTLTPAQKQVAMNNYYRQERLKEQKQAEVDKINAENAPLNNAITGLLHALPHHNRSWSKSRSHTTGSCSNGECNSTTHSSGSSISVDTPF